MTGPFRRKLTEAELEHAYREASGEARLERALRQSGVRPNRALQHRMRPGVLDGIPIEGGGGGGFNPLTLPGTVFYIDCVSPAHTVGTVVSGNSVAITGAAPNFTLAGPGLTAAQAGGTLTLAGWTNPNNNGAKTIASAGVNTCTFENPLGATEAAGATKTWATSGLFTQLVGKGGPGGTTPVTMTAAAQLNQFACNTNRVAGKRIWASGGPLATAASWSRWYTGIEATVFALLNGLTTVSIYIYLYPEAVGSFSPWPVQIGNGGATNATWTGMRSSYGTTTSSKAYARVIAGPLTTTYTLGASAPVFGAWQGFCSVYDGATSTDFYLDAAFLGNAAAGVTRTMTGLDRGIVGCGSSNIAPGNGAPMLLGGVYVSTSPLSIATQAQLTAYFRALIA